MAYHWEKEDNGEYALVIDGFSDGIAPDPYSGMNRLYFVNTNTEGEVSVGYPITTSTLSGGGSSLGTPIARSTRFFAYTTPGVPSGSPQSFAVLDSNGRVWESSSITGTWTFLSSSNSTSGSTSGDGLAYWEGYLFKTRGNNIDYWNGSTWANFTGSSMSDFGAGFKHYMYVGTDNILYVTNGNFIATLALADPSTPTSFDPGNGATYVWSGKKLQLPATDIALSLAEIGGGNTPNSTLLIGGTFNAIYPWNKTAANFALPIYVGDSYIKNIISVNQNAFIFPGNQQGRGRIYITNGSQADLWFKMPDYAFGDGSNDPYFVWGDAIFHRNQLLFGAFVVSNAGTVQLVSQVFAIDLDTKKFRSVSNIPANSTSKANATCLFSTWNLSSPGLGYILAWDDNGSTPGIGYSNSTAGVDPSTVFITTDLMPVGTFTNKKTFTQVEYKLRSPLESGENFSLYPIADGVVGSALSFQPTPTTGVVSGIANVNFQANQWLQFRPGLLGNSGTSGVRLHEIRLR